jgi:hypothetical protein
MHFFALQVKGDPASFLLSNPDFFGDGGTSGPAETAVPVAFSYGIFFVMAFILLYFKSLMNFSVGAPPNKLL